MEGSNFQAEVEAARSAVCRGSIMLGTACGRCERCKEERRKLELAEIQSKAEQLGFGKPKFKLKNEALGPDVIANFRVRSEVHAKIKSMAEANGIGMTDVVRQMIDFALEHT